MLGSPFYMAPAQIRAEALDGRADQFSLAVAAVADNVRSPPIPLFIRLPTSSPPPRPSCGPACLRPPCR